MTISDPRDIPGLRVWYSAQYEATQYADGAQVTTLHDISGNARDAPKTGSQAPTISYTGGPGGGKGLLGANSRGWSAPDSVTSGLTAATAMMTAMSSGSSQGMWTFSSAANVAHFGYGSVPRQVYDNFGSTTRKDAGGFAVVDNTWYRYRVMSKAGGWTNWLDNVQKYTTATNTVGWAAAGASRVGATGSGNPYFLGGMGLFVLYDHELNSTERADIEAWATANPSGGVPVASIALGMASVSSLAQSISVQQSWQIAMTQASMADTARRFARKVPPVNGEDVEAFLDAGTYSYDFHDSDCVLTPRPAA